VTGGWKPRVVLGACLAAIVMTAFGVALLLDPGEGGDAPAAAQLTAVPRPVFIDFTAPG